MTKLLMTGVVLLCVGSAQAFADSSGIATCPAPKGDHACFGKGKSGMKPSALQYKTSKQCAAFFAKMQQDNLSQKSCNLGNSVVGQWDRDTLSGDNSYTCSYTTPESLDNVSGESEIAQEFSSDQPVTITATVTKDEDSSEGTCNIEIKDSSEKVIKVEHLKGEDKMQYTLVEK